MFFAGIIFILIIALIIMWTEETESGNRFTSWLLKKFDGSFFKHLD